MDETGRQALEDAREAGELGARGPLWLVRRRADAREALNDWTKAAEGGSDDAEHEAGCGLADIVADLLRETRWADRQAGREAEAG
jgi:hypothetical protein